ncbi:UNVERIFIED_CONTAM: Abscisic acid receptor PYL8 [Sesamum calycinum]|uniref:Abscisic acid receptor PYL8 n=1 Tax=Sesamum calycinum TaxID=2727403 RepID=A0AAW2RSN4_9LAMI
MNARGLSGVEKEYINKHHKHEIKDNQCTSFLIKHVKAPVHLVWSLVRRFDQPQKYKPFVSRCVVQGNLEIGSLREVDVKSGLPATTSTERLELLDDNEHVLSVRIIGGDHRLRSTSPPTPKISCRTTLPLYLSILRSLKEAWDHALIKCNLKSLADVSERLAVQDRTEPIDRV